MAKEFPRGYHRPRGESRYFLRTTGHPLADALADTPANVSDELYAELRRHFSEEQLIEFAAAAAQENFRARYNRVFDVGSDGLYRKGLQFKQR